MPSEPVRRVVAVTGGLGILGRAIGESVASSGSVVVLTSRDAAAVDRFNQKQHALAADASRQTQFAAELAFDDEDALEAFVEDTCRQHGALTGLVNNAYANTPFRSIEETSWSDWAEASRVNLGMAHGLSAAAVRQRAITGIDSIVNVASIYGTLAPDFSIYEPDRDPSSVLYGTMKAALIRLTRYLAVYWAQDGIRVNAVSPGGVENDQSEPFRSKYAARIPQHRFVDRREVAAAVTFLLSAEASGITGTNLAVDGGLHAW